MAFNTFGEDTGVEDFSGGAVSADERKRRMAMLANLATGGSFSDQLGQFATNRVNQATDRINDVGQALSNPEEEMRKRAGMVQQTQPVGPVMPQEIAQQRQQQPVQQPQQVAQPQAPVAPEQVQQPTQQVQAPINPAQTQLPQPGPGVQVASTQPGAGVQEAANAQQATQQMPSETPDWHDKLTKGSFNDLSGILANPNTPEDVKNEVQDRMYNMLNDKRMEQKANQTLQNAAQGDPRAQSDLARELTKKSGEGSLLKAMFYQRMGLTDLAKDEQQKLGAGTTYAPAFGPKGETAMIKYSADNMPIAGWNSEGKSLDQNQLAQFSAAGIGPHTKSFMMPAVHGTPVQKTNEKGEVETGLMMFDPRSQQSYVQVGSERRPTTGWTTMAQNVQAVYGAAGAKQQGTQAAQTGVQQNALPPMAGQGAATSNAPAPAATTPSTPSAPATTAGGGQAQPAPAKTTTTAATTTANKVVGGGGQVVTQRPGESFDSYQQRKKAAEEQTAANIQANKEVNVAERKPPAEARGKVEAKDVNNQAFADNSYGLIKPISDEIKKSTGSGIGANVDVLASKIGAGTEGAKAIAKLEVLAYPLLANVPRFEGPQSDYDVQTYMKAAGDFQNDKKPASVRLAALQAMVTVLKKYDKANRNDWTFGEGKQSNTGTTSSGNKYKRVE